MRVEVGQIVNTHGIKGEIKVNPIQTLQTLFSTWSSADSCA